MTDLPGPRPGPARADNAQPLDPQGWCLTRCDDCPLRHGPCGPGLTLARRLAAALVLARRTAPALDLAGTARVACGGHNCLLRWQADAAGARVEGHPGPGATVTAMADLRGRLV